MACTKFFGEYNIYKHGGHLNLGYFMVEGINIETEK